MSSSALTCLPQTVISAEATDDCLHGLVDLLTQLAPIIHTSCLILGRGTKETVFKDNNIGSHRIHLGEPYRDKVGGCDGGREGGD